jgi:hypothetical protein
MLAELYGLEPFDVRKILDNPNDNFIVSLPSAAQLTNRRIPVCLRFN